METGDRLAIAYSGATAAAVLDGTGHVQVSIDGETGGGAEAPRPGPVRALRVARAEQHELALEFLAPASAYMFSFAPGPA